MDVQVSVFREQDVAEVGSQLVSGVLAKVEILAAHPDIGRVVPEFGQPSIRELIHPPFRIIYRRFPDKLGILRVWRNERLMRKLDDSELAVDQT